MIEVGKGGVVIQNGGCRIRTRSVEGFRQFFFVSSVRIQPKKTGRAVSTCLELHPWHFCVEVDKVWIPARAKLHGINWKCVGERERERERGQVGWAC